MILINVFFFDMHHALNRQVLATLGLPVTARDVSSLMRRFTAGNTAGSRPFFLYPRLLESITAGDRDSRPNSGTARNFNTATLCNHRLFPSLSASQSTLSLEKR